MTTFLAQQFSGRHSGLVVAFRQVFAVLALVTLTSQPAQAVDVESIDPLALYGESLSFEVWREGTRVGEHVVNFRPDGDELLVDSRFELEIRFLVFSAYKFEYRSSAQWRDGELLSLKAITDDDGQVFETRVEKDGEFLLVQNEKDRERVPLGTFPTNHWHAGVLQRGLVINTITGEANDVRIDRQGVEFVQTANGKIPASRYVYSGDLETEVWYDDRGRWVKMRFRAKDGSIIDYRCRSCSADMVSDSGQ